MDSDSENSFTWTDTSSDSTDSDSMAVAGDALQGETESNKKHSKKRKIREASNDEEVADSKLRIKIEKDQSLSDSNNTNMKRKTVKLEPESDSDVPKKKKKVKDIEINGKDAEDSASYDESYLDLKVKLEEFSVPKSKKKKKHASMDTADINESITIKKGEASSDINEENDSQNSNAPSNGTSKKKKKKSKKRSESESKDDVNIDSKMDIDEQTDRNMSRTSGDRSMETTLNDNNTFQDESGCGEISAIQSVDDENHHIISFIDGKNAGKEKKSKTDNLHKSTVVNQFKMANNNTDLDSINISEKRTPRISDRIRFEDEDDSEAESNSVPEHTDQASSKLRKFIKATSGLKPVSQLLAQSTIVTPDDEIWIVKCPKEVDIQAFCGTEINLPGKCKIKIAGQTYEGSLEDEQCDTLATLSMKHSKYGIGNMPLCGIINFRKRIPKPHFREDNIMVNNQTNFIPLPETKCRHPLFGSNYKKALKIPSAVAERLNTRNIEEEALSTEKRKKKKHKRDKNTSDYDETDAQSGDRIMKSEPDHKQEVPEKKKKKRKHDDYEDGPSAKRVKRIKHDPESEEAWESEKAIEQNLFDF